MFLAFQEFAIYLGFFRPRIKVKVKTGNRYSLKFGFLFIWFYTIVYIRG